MPDYYFEKLSAERLKKVYECAPPRVRQYLQAEIDYVLEHLSPGDTVLELGCGYGRALAMIAPHVGLVIGVDTSFSSLQTAARELKNHDNIFLVQSNAVETGLADKFFDVVLCIQNGISAFHMNPIALVAESIRLTKKGGIVLFSSYAENFWPERLEWFKIQSDLGLIGELDREKTSDGIIVCKDGFTATTYTSRKFIQLMSYFGHPFQIKEIDNSSLFCKIEII